MNRTRYQRRRELKCTICMVLAAIVLGLMVCTMMVKAWAEHPAEQPTSYEEHVIYVQSIGGGADA